MAFKPRPLDEAPILTASATQLSVDVSPLKVAPLTPRVIDPVRGVDPIDVAILAVLNSPDLAARRAAVGVSAAQVFSARLLPDPQWVLSADLPDHPEGLVTAYSLSPSMDIGALITHAATLAAAKASAKQAHLDLLWSEWSVAQQARQLAVTALIGAEKADSLARIAAELSDRAQATDQALKAGDVTASTAAADLAAKLDAAAQLAASRREGEKARLQLNALMGLDPTVHLKLIDGPWTGALDASASRLALQSLPGRRPDLLALKAGYESQNALLRKAILAQFPLLNLGYSRQSDTSAILSHGLTATVTAPILNRGRGDIAVQEATREQLAREYRARLDQTAADVAQARSDIQTSQADLDRLAADVPRLEARAASARPAFVRGDLDSAAFAAVSQTALKETVALWDARLTRRLAEIGLETLLFLPPAPMPDRGTPP